MKIEDLDFLDEYLKSIEQKALADRCNPEKTIPCLKDIIQSNVGRTIQTIAEPFKYKETRIGFRISLDGSLAVIKPASPACFFKKFNGYGSDIDAIDCLYAKEFNYYIVFAYNEGENPYLLPPRKVFFTDTVNDLIK